MNTAVNTGRPKRTPRYMLREQGCSPGEQEAAAGWEREEQLGDFKLEGRQAWCALRQGLVITG